jgi:hypothetical protein
MEYLTDKNKRKGVTITVIIHVLILLLFVFTGLTIPVPLPEQGIRVNFGTTEEGMGDVQPDEATNSSEDETVEDQPEEIIESNPEPTPEIDEVITQTTEEAPAVNTAEPVEIEPEVIEEKEPEPVVDQSALYPGKQSTDATESYEGETGNPGDQGIESGDKDAKVHGISTGPGKGFSLAGRNITFRPSIKENSAETGKVVVSIVVNRSGNVQRATPGAKGSTTTSAHLYKLAKAAALKAKFSANRDAPEEQKGTIEFIFKVSN